MMKVGCIIAVWHLFDACGGRIPGHTEKRVVIRLRFFALRWAHRGTACCYFQSCNIDAERYSWILYMKAD